MSSTDISAHLGTKKSIPVSYTRRDLILYSLGIGATEPQFVYENDSGFAAFPTFPMVLGFKGKEQDVVSFPSPAMMESMVAPPLPGTRFALDGERCLEILKPLPSTCTEFNLKTTLVGVHARGKGALVETESLLEGKDGEVFVKIVSGAFMVGAKGFTPKALGVSFSEKISVPARGPDAVVTMKTSPDQTHIYRLSGDYNPLHIDPTFAKMNGFKQPILHGLCTFGFAARAVLKEFGGNDPSRFKVCLFLHFFCI